MTGLAILRRASTLTSAVLVTAAAVLLFAAAAIAQGYPSRAVRIVVPFPAGGPLDFTARLLADKFSASAKQPFVVENRPGAAGSLGTDAVAKAAPDGYTLLLVLDTPLTVNPWLYSKLPFDPVRDFTPISTVASFSLTLVVHPLCSREFRGGIRRLRENPEGEATAFRQWRRTGQSGPSRDGIFPHAGGVRGRARAL